MTAALRQPVGAWHGLQRVSNLVEFMGSQRRLAGLLDVAPSQVTRWLQGKDAPSPVVARRIADLDHVVALICQVWEPDVGRDWLATPNGHLDGATPARVVYQRGSTNVVAAIRAEAEGAYV